MTSQDAFRAALKASSYKAFTLQDEERLAERLPPEVIELLKADGFASYGEQQLWSVDPDDLGELVLPWKAGAEAAIPIFRTAFGCLFLWDGKRVHYANIHFHTVTICAPRVRFLFSDTFMDEGFMTKVVGSERIKRAQNELGQLSPNEAYFWVPALALGGSQETSRLDKGGLRELLAIQAQLAPIVRP